MTTTPHDKALKPCPFCGSKANLFHSGAGYWDTCTNEECECETPGRADPAEAAWIWNRRAEPRFSISEAGNGDDSHPCKSNPVVSQETAIWEGNGDGWKPTPRGGTEPNWWEEWVKTTRAYNAIAKAAQAVIDETDNIHDSEPVPVKYRAPYGSITKLREVLALSDRSSLASPPSIRSSDTGMAE